MQQQDFLIAGPAGQLEVKLARPSSWHDTQPFVVCCHPHPQHGGSLNNKVVHTLAKTYFDSGLAVLRFNFRGVGQSLGQFDDGRGEQEDLLSVVQWMRAQHPAAICWLAGFSFGGYIAAAAHEPAQAQYLTLVAPAVPLYDVNQLRINRIPWLLVMDSHDEVVSALQVKHWLALQSNPPVQVWLDEVGHFFHGKLTLLRNACLQHLPLQDR
ncbi:MAG: alpha/beta hydrolase [Gammaproteobacteria bacterium]|nr:alpha/beta hydrolase [Gammaproteobacteria bacterium]